MLALVLTTVLLAPSSVDLLGLDGAAPGAELPPGWRLRPVSGVTAPVFRVDRQEGVGAALAVAGRGAAAWVFHELDRPLSEPEGRLIWSWRTLGMPAGADLGRAGGDDAPLRVYVVFGKPSLLGRARAIFYSWDGAGAGERLAFESDRIAVVPVAGEADGRWAAASARPFRDYRRLFGEEAPPIRVVGVMQDTDDTGAAAAAELRALVWQPEPAAG